MESLLAQDEKNRSFLETPAIEVAAEAFAKEKQLPDQQMSALETAAMLAHYRISGKLGEGGMGEVYRARDTRLQRDVALKILPQAMSHDRQLMARFEREARTLASLNHPNIAAIHGLEESGGFRALAMELVEGETLAERIAGEPKGIPCQDVLPIARQIAEALEYAHERGVIHRDLKPANVKITPEGTVKVLDFGLAKVLDARDATATMDMANSPTLSAMATQPGTILGTAAYMSPEHAKGLPVDRRTDIWGFACVLFETLSGHKAFEGETIQDVLAAVLTKEPDWAALPETPPPSIQKLIRRCLAKDARQRWRDMGDARIAIEETLAGDEGAGLVPGVNVISPTWPQGSPLRQILPWFAGIVIGAIAGGLIVWRALSPRTPATRPPQELSEERLTANPSEDPVQAAAISPDGKFLAYSDQNGTHLRLIKTGDTRDLLSHLQLIVSSICWLPDGSGIMVTGSQHGEPAGIWVISVLGGTPHKLRDNAAQAALSPDGSQVAFLAGPEVPNPAAPGAPGEIWVMNASGEQARRILTAQPGQAFRCLRWSPDGHRIMYLKSYFDSGGPEEAIQSVDLKGGAVAPVVSSPTFLGDFCWLPDGRVLYSQGRWVAYSSNSNLWEIGVDTRTGKTKGVPAKVANGAGFYFSGLSRTANGKQMVFLKMTPQSDVSVGDLNSQGTSLTTSHQLTFNENNDWPGGWTPDGKAVVFWSDRSGKSAFYKKNLIGGEAELLFPSSQPVWYVRYSPDGSWFFYMALPKTEGIPGPTVPVNLMRLAVSGGTPRLVFRALGMSNFRCARSPANVCVYEHDQGAQAFFEFGPVRGKGREVARIPRAPPGVGSSWFALSPDGSSLAVIDSAWAQEGRIRLIPLNGGPSSELAVKGWNGLTEMDWSPDGKALYVSSVTRQHAAILRADLKGRARPLWEGNPIPDTCGSPSPDGRHLAIAVWTTDSNAWIMKNF